MARLVLVVVAVLLSGCKAKTSVAQPSLEAFVNYVAQKRTGEAEKLLAEGTSMSGANPGTELKEGIAEHPVVAIGDFDWSRFKLEGEEVQPDGRRVLRLLSDICLKAEDSSGGCTRPNQYRVTARMVNAGGAWLVESAFYEAVSLVR
ncbi:MAG: hypothetical protein JNJ54_20535 [Myxococcaceae bacterium]|nr:hypothetical protein [Myxococcaceae bacterium]